MRSRRTNASTLSSRLRPTPATSAAEPRRYQDWIYDVTWDGNRALAITIARVPLVSRDEKDLTRDAPRSRGPSQPEGICATPDDPHNEAVAGACVPDFVPPKLPPSRPSRWRCPACASPIPRGAMEDLPRPGTVYRSPVCRLELTYDEKRNTLDVPPLDFGPNDKPAKRRR